MAELTAAQLAVVTSAWNSKVFLSGPAGCGKTTAGRERLRALLEAGIPGSAILLLTPQRTLQEPYLALLDSPERDAGGDVVPATMGGLARRMVDLFWPLCAEQAGFARPDLPPVTLTLETAQYYMAHIVRPLIDAGYFQSITIDRNRLYSQIIDNLNKAAAVGFAHTEIGERLDAASFGDGAQRRVYADAQDCANRFRQFCLEHNLLDFSLQLEIFTNILWEEPVVRAHLLGSYRHLIYDNVEEDVPRAHDIVRAWLPELDSALLIYDEGAGYRRFLGADTQTGQALRELCDQEIILDRSFVSSGGIESLGADLADAILPGAGGASAGTDWEEQALQVLQTRFYPELLDATADEVRRLVDGGLPPSEIVVLAPYLPDALRFSLMNRLEQRGLPVRSHRPSRSLRDEPASRTLLTLAALAHPEWAIQPPRFDVAYALRQAIAGLDLVRAQMLADITYHPRQLSLSSFEAIKPEMQQRITYAVGNRFAQLQDWLAAYRAGPPLPLDHFLRRLFGELLSQPGFGFHDQFDAVRVAASLVESVRKFRQALEPAGAEMNTTALGREYIVMLEEGVLAAQYLEGWENENKDAVLVAPAYTFLMMNRPASVQFWLDAGSSGWYARLAQPLTHPYVLARGWQPGQGWSDADEVAYNSAAMARLVYGLLRRCRSRLYLGLTELGESGYEQRGELLKAFQKVLARREAG